jgi:DNA repair exonuclease SbcCD ATPase subunit
MKININSLHVRNFLSVGNKWIDIFYEKGLFRVSGENLDNNTRNGLGKCLDGTTQIEISVKQKKILKHLNLLNNKTTIKDIVDLFIQFPNYKSKILVKTPYGFKEIQEATQTDFSIPLEIVTSNNKKIICSKNHLFKIDNNSILSNESFKKAEDFKINDQVVTEDGFEIIKEITPKTVAQPLFDLQVAEVKQFYSNGILSHNSSIFVDGLMFGLFGKPVRKVNLESLVNKNNQKFCEIKVDFNVENRRYLIHRGIKPSFLKLYEDYDESQTNPEIEDSAKKFTQKRIDALLSANFNTFNHLLVMTSAYTTPFLELDSSKKRQVIEDLLGVSIFGEMSEKAKDLFLDHKNNLSVISKEYELTSSNLNTLIANNNSLQLKSNEFKINKKKKLDNIKSKLIAVIAEIEKTNNEIKDVTTSDSTISDLQEEKKLLLANLSENDVNTRFLKSKLSANLEIINNLKETPVCPLCKTSTDSDHISSHLANLKLENSSNIAEVKSLKLVKEETEHKLLTINSKLDQISSNQKLMLKLENKLENLTSEKNELKLRATEIKEETNNFEDLINLKDVTTKTLLLQDLDAKMKISVEEKLYNDYIRKMLSNEGVKNYIISKILIFWNKKVNFYLSKLNAEFSLSFDDKLEATIKSRNTDPLTYHSFSGGEKARIDVAILLSIIDVSKLQNSIDLNVMVVDEVLDGGLDDVGREEVVNLFKHMTTHDNKSIFIISHNMNLGSEVFDKEIILQKKHGFTSLV